MRFRLSARCGSTEASFQKPCEGVILRAGPPASVRHWMPPAAADIPMQSHKQERKAPTVLLMCQYPFSTVSRGKWCISAYTSLEIQQPSCHQKALILRWSCSLSPVTYPWFLPCKSKSVLPRPAALSYSVADLKPSVLYESICLLFSVSPGFQLSQ